MISEAAKAQIPNLKSKIFYGRTGSGKSSNIAKFIERHNYNQITIEEGETSDGVPFEEVYYTENKGK